MGSASRKLSLVHAEAGATGADFSRAEVTVALQLDGGVFEARFEVRGLAIHADPDYAQGSSQWGLWNADVVELFVCARGQAALPAYYEFQVSPLDQHFELEIFEPRARFNKDFVSGFRHEAEVDGPDAWRATMRIPLVKLAWDGKPESLIGNAFAILGRPGQRTYWGLTLPKQDKPDFHRPEYFSAFFGS